MYEQQQKYLAVVISNKLAVAKTGTYSVQIQFGALYNLANPDVPVQKQFWANLYLTDETFERTMDTLSTVFGFNDNDITVINNNPYLFEGIQAILVTDMEEYEGRPQEKVKFINHPHGGVKPLDDLAAATIGKQLENKLKAYFMKNKDKAGPPPVKGTASPQQSNTQAGSQPAQNQYGYATGNPPPPSDDDLPF